VGLEKNVWTLKRTLLQTEVSVVGVQGMGGLGKTTLALAISKSSTWKYLDSESLSNWRLYISYKDLSVHHCNPRLFQ